MGAVEAARATLGGRRDRGWRRGVGSRSLLGRSRALEPEWRNGRRGGLKIRCQQWRVGSSPTSGILENKGFASAMAQRARGRKGRALGAALGAARFSSRSRSDRTRRAPPPWSSRRPPVAAVSDGLLPHPYTGPPYRAAAELWRGRRGPWALQGRPLSRTGCSKPSSRGARDPAASDLGFGSRQAKGGRIAAIGRGRNGVKSPEEARRRRRSHAWRASRADPGENTLELPATPETLVRA